MSAPQWRPLIFSSAGWSVPERPGECRMDVAATPGGLKVSVFWGSPQGPWNFAQLANALRGPRRPFGFGLLTTMHIVETIIFMNAKVFDGKNWGMLIFSALCITAPVIFAVRDLNYIGLYWCGPIAALLFWNGLVSYEIQADTLVVTHAFMFKFKYDLKQLHSSNSVEREFPEGGSGIFHIFKFKMRRFPLVIVDQRKLDDLIKTLKKRSAGS